MHKQVVQTYAMEYYTAIEILRHYTDTKYYQLSETIVWSSKKDKHNLYWQKPHQLLPESEGGLGKLLKKVTSGLFVVMKTSGY